MDREISSILPSFESGTCMNHMSRTHSQIKTPHNDWDDNARKHPVGQMNISQFNVTDEMSPDSNKIPDKNIEDGVHLDKTTSCSKMFVTSSRRLQFRNQTDNPFLTGHSSKDESVTLNISRLTCSVEVKDARVVPQIEISPKREESPPLTTQSIADCGVGMYAKQTTVAPLSFSLPRLRTRIDKPQPVLIEATKLQSLAEGPLDQQEVESQCRTVAGAEVQFFSRIKKVAPYDLASFGELCPESPSAANSAPTLRRQRKYGSHNLAKFVLRRTVSVPEQEILTQKVCQRSPGVKTSQTITSPSNSRKLRRSSSTESANTVLKESQIIVYNNSSLCYNELASKNTSNPQRHKRLKHLFRDCSQGKHHLNGATHSYHDDSSLAGGIFNDGNNCDEITSHCGDLLINPSRSCSEVGTISSIKSRDADTTVTAGSQSKAFKAMVAEFNDHKESFVSDFVEDVIPGLRQDQQIKRKRGIDEDVTPCHSGYTQQNQYSTVGHSQRNVIGSNDGNSGMYDVTTKPLEEDPGCVEERQNRVTEHDRQVTEKPRGKTDKVSTETEPMKPSLSEVTSSSRARTEDCLSSIRRHSLAVRVDARSGDKCRRNSVSVLPRANRRSSNPSLAGGWGGLTSGRALSSGFRGRSSSRTALDKLLASSIRGPTGGTLSVLDCGRSASSSSLDIAAGLEFLAWTQLVAALPASELPNTSVTRSQVSLSLPVCHVTRGERIVSVTSVEAIERSLSFSYPELQILFGPLAVPKLLVDNITTDSTQNTETPLNRNIVTKDIKEKSWETTGSDENVVTVAGGTSLLSAIPCIASTHSHQSSGSYLEGSAHASRDRTLPFEDAGTVGAVTPGRGTEANNDATSSGFEPFPTLEQEPPLSPSLVEVRIREFKTMIFEEEGPFSVSFDVTSYMTGRDVGEWLATLLVFFWLLSLGKRRDWNCEDKEFVDDEPEGEDSDEAETCSNTSSASRSTTEMTVSSLSSRDAKDEVTDLATYTRPLGTRRKMPSLFNPDNYVGTDVVEAQRVMEAGRRVSINTCIRTMREGRDDYSNQLLMVENVGHYAEEETMKVVLAKSDAISCVIHAMKAFPEREELQQQACASLLKMASISEANCLYICQHEGVSALAGTLRRYEHNLDIARTALSVVAYISVTESATKDLLHYGCHSDVLSAMSRHCDDRVIVRQCCFILGNLVVSAETAQQLMLVGGVHTIIAMLKRYHDDIDVLENGCRALGSFALYEDSCLDVAQAGATATVVDTMTSSYSDLGVKECCLWALACLTSVGQTCEELISLHGLPVLLEVLEDFPEEEVLQDNGLRCLCNLGAHEYTVAQVSSCRVADVLLSLYQNFPDNVEMMENMMLALSQVAATESEVQEYMLAGEGLDYVISIMRALQENPAVQENGCRIIGNIAVNKQLRKPTEHQGASQAVVGAMLHVDSSPDIQLYGCMALMNLTADVTDNKMKVKNHGGVPALLTALRRFPENPDVVLAALKTLGNLVDLEEACRQLLDDGGLATIIHIAKDDRVQNHIRAFAGQVLAGLTALPDLSVEDLLKTEEVLVTLQAAIPRDPDMAFSLCQGLHNLLKSDIGMETLIHTGWMAIVEQVMRMFDDQPEIHLTSCRIVASVAMECHRRLETRPVEQCPLAESTVSRMLHSMRQYPREKELQLVGCAALSCVCESFGHLRKFLLLEGALGDVIRAMKSFPTDDRLNSIGLIALSYLLPLDVAGTNARDADRAVDVITSTMSHFVEDEDIQISACKALERCDVTSKEHEFQILTCVHNAVRRHKTPTVVAPAAQLFRKFGGLGDEEDLTEQMLESPSSPLNKLFHRLMLK